MSMTVGSQSVLRYFLKDNENYKYNEDKMTVTGDLSGWKVTAGVIGALAILATVISIIWIGVCFSFADACKLGTFITTLGLSKPQFYATLIGSGIVLIGSVVSGLLLMNRLESESPKTPQNQIEHEKALSNIKHSK